MQTALRYRAINVVLHGGEREVGGGDRREWLQGETEGNMTRGMKQFVLYRDNLII